MSAEKWSNFQITTGLAPDTHTQWNNQCWILFFGAFRPITSLKSYSSTGAFFVNFTKIPRKTSVSSRKWMIASFCIVEALLRDLYRKREWWMTTWADAVKLSKFSLINPYYNFTILQFHRNQSMDFIKDWFNNSMQQWHRVIVVITAAQFLSTKPELWFCVGSNPARDVS